MLGIHPDDRKYFAFDIQGELFSCSALPFGWNQSSYAFCSAVRVWVAWMRAPASLPALDSFDRVGVAPSSEHPYTRYPPEHSRSHPTAPRFGFSAPKNPHTTPTRAAFGPSASFRTRGCRMLWYVDDMLFLCDSKAEMYLMRTFVERSLHFLGMQRNPTKGVWEPSQVLTHLGLEVDTRTDVFRLTAARAEKLKRLSRQLCCSAKREKRYVSARALASFTGLAQSAYLAVPPARFYLRELHDCLSMRQSWLGKVRLTKQAFRDLAWWQDVPPRWAERRLRRSPDTASLHCDASGTVGWGGVLNNLLPTRGSWRPHQFPLHITLKELKAVRYTVETFLRELAGKRVLL
jgi:hypothetical protein